VEERRVVAEGDPTVPF